MRSTCICLCAYFSLPLVGAALADERPLVIDVWPGQVAGDHGQIGPERVRARDEAPTPDAKWITNVTRPTISVFRPDARRNTRVAIVVCPGGGYWNLAWDKEGEEVATWLNTVGITGVVLKYRVPRANQNHSPHRVRSWTRSARSALCAVTPPPGRSIRSGLGSWGSRPAATWP
ncbi:MAG: hypothetical protein MUF48_24370 [Pirellulaceae bacterium]|nr:hypothetical protein [Pirellulaceae bacterium]